MRTIISSTGTPEREWRASLWFVMLSPLLGILLGFLALIAFAD